MCFFCCAGEANRSRSKCPVALLVARPAAETLQAWPERMQYPFNLSYNISIDVCIYIRITIIINNTIVMVKRPSGRLQKLRRCCRGNTCNTKQGGITSKRTRRLLARQCDCLPVAPRHEAQFASLLHCAASPTPKRRTRACDKPQQRLRPRPYPRPCCQIGKSSSRLPSPKPWAGFRLGIPCTSRCTSSRARPGYMSRASFFSFSRS